MSADKFPDSLRVRHDMIHPEQPYERDALTYPLIEAMVPEIGRQ